MDKAAYRVILVSAIMIRLINTLINAQCIFLALKF